MAVLRYVARGFGSGDQGLNAHGCNIIPFIKGKSGTVFVGGFGVARHTDQMVVHVKGIPPFCKTHAGKSTGKDTFATSPEIVTTLEDAPYPGTTVFVEGLPIARMDDIIEGTSPKSCGMIKTINQTTVSVGK
tara:strand:+ start:86 stop:481 length:396 start_codon:yes stop_codon:yes gene_type:complete